MKVGDLVRVHSLADDLGLIIERTKHPYGSVFFKVQRLRDGKILSSLSSDLVLANESR